MAYYQKPDREEYYTGNFPEMFVVSYYDDSPNLVNWRYEDTSGVNDADTCSIEEVKEIIKSGNYRLKSISERSWNASNTRSNERSKEIEDQCVANGGHHWFGVGGSGVSKCWNCEKCVSSD